MNTLTNQTLTTSNSDTTNGVEKKHLYLNPNVIGLKESPTLRINQHCKELAAKGKHIYKLGLGQSPFPVPEPVVNALRLYAPQKDYLHVQGLPELRKAVADFHRKKDGVNILPENVIIGPGSKELLFLLQMVFEGEVIIPSPSWVSYLPQAKIIGNTIHIIQTLAKDKWRLLPEQLEEFCQRNKRPDNNPYLLILNYPGNPDGITYGAESVQQLAETCRKNNIYILSDEIYGQLHHEGKHISIAKYYPEGTIISSGLSKWCGAGGWRLGTFSFPPNLHWLMDAMAAVASETYTSVSAPIQYAAIQAFLCGSEIENYLSHVRKILALLGKETAAILKSGNISVNDPTGGFYLFLDFTPLTEKLMKKGIINGSILCDRLLDECGVAILPGVDFNRPEEELSARLSYVDFDGAKALSASYSIPLHEKLPADFLVHYCGNVIEAADKIVEWVNGE
ncbi:MAG: aminotransferase class I/II-fold pyridoxal phosphate-dependent enzyme [Chitinophagaceae bacterium]|nr:aminotransferase class I/II-fold pyridoxal phosphate-dependent enzyme [Chitinophagaceae bacterium]